MWLEGETGPEGPWRGLGFHPKSGERAYRGSCPNPSGLLGGDTCRDPLPSLLSGGRVHPHALASRHLLSLLGGLWPTPSLYSEARSDLCCPGRLPLECREARQPLSRPDGTWRPSSLTLSWLSCFLSLHSSAAASRKPLLPMTGFLPFLVAHTLLLRESRTWCLFGARTLTSGFFCLVPHPQTQLSWM